jgi:hypothetical protein
MVSGDLPVADHGYVEDRSCIAAPLDAQDGPNRASTDGVVRNLPLVAGADSLRDNANHPHQCRPQSDRRQWDRTTSEKEALCGKVFVSLAQYGKRRHW